MLYFVGFENLLNALLAMNEPCFNMKGAVDVFGQVLRTIHTAMLPARTSEAKHKVCELPLNVAFYMVAASL